MKLAVFAILIIVALSFSSGTAATVGRVPAYTATSAVQPGRQLADEIIRRLRRMGFNAIQSRSARPAEMLGELC